MFADKPLFDSKRYTFGEKITGFVLITGSDQVFNPDIIASGGLFDDTYLLANAASGIKRISYAASFGNSTLATEFYERYKAILCTFNGISLREESGRHVVESMGIKATSAPDPVILLDDFSQLVKMGQPSEDYSLSFVFCHSDSVLGEKIKEKGSFYKLSPEKWILTIHNAHFVVTDSFHCMV